eukprot:scaffold201956_cov36-Cyclotella_meneghiniana.AAC.1
MSDSTEDTMDKVIKGGMTADDEDSDETESVLIERTKPKRVIHESTGGIFSDASTGTAATALSKEEVTVEEASDEDVMRPDPPSTSSSRDKQVDEADLPTNQDTSDDWEDVPEEEVPVISSVKEAAAKKLSPKKNQATIKSMFQRQKKQQQISSEASPMVTQSRPEIISLIWRIQSQP